MIVDRIEAYFRGEPRGTAANLRLPALRVMEQLLRRSEPEATVETGCGLSTILLRAVSRRHIAFAEDDRGSPNGAVDLVDGCPVEGRAPVEWVFGRPGETLPRHEIPLPVDFVLLGGIYDHPFPAAECSLLVPRLKIGSGILAFGDLQLPHVRVLFEHLAGNPMFEVAGLAGPLGFLRRTEAEFEPLPADWAERPLPAEAMRSDDSAVLLDLARRMAGRASNDLEGAQLAANLGQAALGANDLDAAEQAFRDAIGLQSDNAAAYDGLARVAAARRNPLEAARLRRWATLLDPNRLQLRLEFARDLVRLGRGRDAEQVLGEAIAQAPKHREALDLLADLYEASGRKPQADACREKAAEPGPEPEPAVYEPERRLDFKQGGEGGAHLGRGWHGIEGWGPWSRGSDSVIEFRLDPDVAARAGRLGVLEIDWRASHVAEGFRPALVVFVNQVAVAVLEPAAAREGTGAVRFVVRFDSGALRPGRTNTIGFRYRTPLVPKLVGLGDDLRVLGFRLVGLRIGLDGLPENP
jgi:tetratricopeptide (TPR) repeat protein